MSSTTEFKYACGCDCPCVSQLAEENWDYYIHISECVTDLCSSHMNEMLEARDPNFFDVEEVEEVLSPKKM